MFEWFDLIRVLFGSSAVVALICQTGLVIRQQMQGQAEAAKIRAASEGKVAEIRATADADVVRTWATSEAKIAEMHVAHDLRLALERDRANRPRRQLQRVRPTPDGLDHREGRRPGRPDQLTASSPPTPDRLDGPARPTA